MPTERRSPAALSLALTAMTIGTMTGCTMLRTAAESQRPAAQPVAPDPAALRASALADELLGLHRYAGAPPEEQARLHEAARQAWEQAPSPATQLHYALILGFPGHAAADAPRARQLLQELLAEPARLSPLEHAAAFVELRRLDRELVLVADVQQLKEEAGRIDGEALAALNRRLLAETDENQRLRRALEDAQAKLAAIALIERQTSDRAADPEAPPEQP